MLAAKSNSMIIRDALVSILSNSQILAALDRPPTVVIDDPNETISFSEIPYVWIGNPNLTEQQQWTNDYWREVYNVEVAIIDAAAATPDGNRKVVDEMQLLRTRLINVLMKTPNLNLAYLHVQNSFVRFDIESEIGENEAGNYLRIRVFITIPIIVKQDRVWWIDETEYGYGYGTDGSLDYNDLIQ